MNTIKLFILTAFSVLTLISCGNEENSYEPKYYEQEIKINGYEADTIISLSHLTSNIKEIDITVSWLKTEILDPSKQGYQIKLIHIKNTTPSIRTAILSIACDNGDILVLKVLQGIIDDFGDLHDNVSDKPALAPLR